MTGQYKLNKQRDLAKTTKGRDGPTGTGNPEVATLVPKIAKTTFADSFYTNAELCNGGIN